METISRDESVDRAYLAGILDGEGYMGFTGKSERRNGKVIQTEQIRLGVKNTNPYMIRRISEIYVSWGITFHVSYEKDGQMRLPDSKKPNRDRMTIAVCGSRGVRKILEKVVEFLTTKKDEALCLLSYLKWRLDEMPMHMTKRTHGGYSKFPFDVRTEVNAMKIKAKSDLQDIRARRFGFHRLPRRASQVLDLTNLEVMV